MYLKNYILNLFYVFEKFRIVCIRFSVLFYIKLKKIKNKLLELNQLYSFREKLSRFSNQFKAIGLGWWINLNWPESEMDYAISALRTICNAKIKVHSWAHTFEHFEQMCKSRLLSGLELKCSILLLQVIFISYSNNIHSEITIYRYEEKELFYLRTLCSVMVYWLDFNQLDWFL